MVNMRQANVALIIKGGGSAFVQNGSDQELFIRQGMIVAGFGKGKFRFQEGSTATTVELKPKERLFQLPAGCEEQAITSTLNVM